MTKDEQKLFVSSLVNSIANNVLDRADKWPEEWDGIELRVLLSEAFTGLNISDFKKRIKDAKNEILVRNLI